MSDCSSIRERFFAPGALARSDPELASHLSSCSVCREAVEALPAVDGALAELAASPVSIPPFERIAGAAASAALSRRRRASARRTLPFLATGGLAAAAAVLIAVLVGHHPSPEGPARLFAGSVLDASTSPRTAVFSSGALVRLQEGTAQVLGGSAGEERLQLDSGTVTLEVPKLPAGCSLAVHTPEAEVRVHGTRFQVRREAGSTFVAVENGKVEVRPEGQGRPAQILEAGSSTRVESLQAYRLDLRKRALSALDQGDVDDAEQRLDRLLATAPELSSAAEAQALLAWAQAARGERRRAIDGYRRALAQLPESEHPLWADNACAEMALLLEHEDAPQATGAWAEYVRRFPEGLHAPMARARALAGQGREH